MKKLIKSALSIALVVTMLLSLSITSFAENPGVISSHVEFEVTDAGVSARAFYRDLETTYSDSSTSNGRSGMLIFAAYDANGVLTNAVTDVGLNRILKTEAVSIPEGGSAKAFVWENSNEKVISDVAVYKASGYDFEDVLDTLEITFGGQSFENFVGEAFDKATTTYGPVTITAETLPQIKATVKDNATYVNAYQTASAYIVEVKSSVSKSESVIGSVNTHRGAAAYAVDVIRPTYTDSRTYTINYVIEAAKPTKINPDKEILFWNNEIEYALAKDGETKVAYNSARYNTTNYGMINAASAEVTLAEGAKTAKVDVTIGASPVQNAFIVVRPANGENGINNKVIVADAEGTALTTQNDGNSYKTSFVKEDKTVGHTYYQKSSTSPVVYTDTSAGTTQNFWVGYELNGDTDAGDTGAYVVNRNPVTEMLHLSLANDTIKNAEWIPYSSNTATTGGTFTFYVGQNAVIDVYTKTSGNTYASNTPSITDITIEANDVAVADTVKASEKALIGYTQGPIHRNDYAEGYEVYYDLLLAYFDYKGYVDGIHYRTTTDQGGSIYVYNSIDTYSGNNAGTSDLINTHGMWNNIVLSATGEKVTVDVQNSTTVAALNAAFIHPSDDARLWVDGVIGGTLKTREQLVSLFDSSYNWPKAAKFELPATDVQLVQKFSEFAAKYGQTFNNDSLCTPDIVQFIPGTTTGTVLDVYSDASTVAAYVTDYDTLFGFEGGAIVRPQLEWNNGGYTPLTMVNGNASLGIPATLNTPLYTFNVTQDSIVYVLTPHGYSYARTNVNLADGWIPSTVQPVNMLVTDKAPGMFVNNGNQQYAFKYFDAGSTVTINVPENGVRPVVIVKPL